MGIGFGFLISMTIAVFPGSYNFTVSGDDFFNPFYYAFVTMSTLGYGDLLPLKPVAKSMAVFMTLCGQFYLVTIMAFLIGKLLSQKQE